MNHEKENKMSKLIYVFKTKFAKGNFDIQMYELPVENETAKTYFVDNPYTYRSRILKKDIGIVIENSFGNMQVYLEDNDFSKARTIFAAYNMDKLENAKRKVDMFIVRNITGQKSSALFKIEE